MRKVRATITHNEMVRGLQNVGLRRTAATILLVLFVSDLGLHLALSLRDREAPSAAYQFQPQRSSPGERDDPSRCGIPGHGNEPFHHHHFPSVLTQFGFAAPYSYLLAARAARPPGFPPARRCATPARAPPTA